MPTSEVVTWNSAPNVFAFRYPNRELTTKSKIYVCGWQEAVLAKEGEFIGPIPSGEHTLGTLTYPALSNWVAQKESVDEIPFVADVWFADKAISLNVKWGTGNPLQVEDPLCHIKIPVRAFGQYAVKIANSQKFIAKLAGKLPVFVEKTLSEYFRGVIVERAEDNLTSYLVDESTPALQIPSRQNEISRYLEDHFATELEDYGLHMVSFAVNSVSIDEKDPAVSKLKETLAKKQALDKEQALAREQALVREQALAKEQQKDAPADTRENNLQMTSPSSQPESKCPKCGSVVSAGTKFCVKCGQALRKICPSCKAPVPEGVKFCPKCGNRMLCLCPSCKAEVVPGTKFCLKCGTKL